MSPRMSAHSPRKRGKHGGESLEACSSECLGAWWLQCGKCRVDGWESSVRGCFGGPQETSLLSPGSLSTSNQMLTKIC